MTTRILHGMLLGIATSILLSSVVAAAPPRPLTDHQLDAVYAAGFDIRVDLDVDFAASDPDSVLVFGGCSEMALQNLVNQGLAVSRNSAGARSGGGTFDPNGTYMPNLQHLTTNAITLGDGAFQNANNLLNVFALQGDIAVGVNLNVIVNPTNSWFNVTQTNVNWGSLGLSNAFSTPQ